MKDASGAEETTLVQPSPPRGPGYTHGSPGPPPPGRPALRPYSLSPTTAFNPAGAMAARIQLRLPLPQKAPLPRLKTGGADLGPRTFGGRPRGHTPCAKEPPACCCLSGALLGNRGAGAFVDFSVGRSFAEARAWEDRASFGVFARKVEVALCNPRCLLRETWDV